MRRALGPRTREPVTDCAALIAIAASGVVDRKWYRATYPDVAAAGADPVVHYVRYGWREGRDPGPLFSTPHYLADNPDVAAAGVNPLHHYLVHGWREGRTPRPDYNAAELERRIPAARWLDECPLRCEAALRDRGDPEPRPA